jgi:hypothetical protein
MNANDLHQLSATHAQPHPTPTPGSALHTIFMDSIRLGPAPTRAREGAVIVATVILIALLVLLLDPPIVLAAIITAVVALHMAVRWVIGSRKWARR